MGNENMRDRPDNPAEDPLAELARLMAQEDDFAELARQAPAPAPAPRPVAPPAPARPAAAPRRPGEEGRPAPGSFAALAAEVYGEGVPRAAPMARAGAEEGVREAHREPARGERPDVRPPDARAPYVPPRPQAAEPVRRAPLTRPEAPTAPSPAARPVSERPEAPRSEPLRGEAPRPQAPRPPMPADAARQEALRQEALRQEALRQEAARQDVARQQAARQEAARREALRQEAVRQEAVRQEAARREAVRPPAAPAVRAGGAPADAGVPAWMTRATAAARAAGDEAPVPQAPAPAAARPPARQAPPQAAPAFDLDEDAYDYGRSAADSQIETEAYEEYEAEEEAPGHRNRNRLLMIGGAVVIFIGAAAVGYVFMGGSSGNGVSGEPPVIRADQGPNKVVPNQPTQDQAADGQKLIYDRVGGSATTGNEQVVSSEEQPVDVSQAAQPQPRVIQTTPSGGSSATAPQAASSEPKRVRTLTVRADGTVVEDTSPPASPLPSGASAAPSAAGNPVALNLGTGDSVPTDPAPLSSTPSIVDNMAATPAPAPAPAANPAPARVAAAPTPAPAPAPVASSSTSASVPSGAYVVQIAAVRSEAEAQATWRGAQAKYGMLANQPLSVKRADLGDRGIFYRVQAGSFSDRDGAVGLCEALKAQGGNCMVVRN